MGPGGPHPLLLRTRRTVSTDVALIKDALEPEKYALLIYAGTGGIALLAHDVTTERGIKVWFDAKGLAELAAAIELARSFQPGKEL